MDDSFEIAFLSLSLAFSLKRIMFVISPSGCRLCLALKLLLLLLLLSLLLLIELEDVDCLRVRAEDEEMTVLAEGQAVHGCTALHASPKSDG